jgi:hypothetical protein
LRRHSPIDDRDKGHTVTVTTTKLTRAAALAAAASGLLFILVQPIHPPDEVAHVVTGTWRTVHVLSIGMSALGLVGLTGLYLRQVREMKVLGLIGYALFASFYAIAIGFQLFEVLLLPSVATEAPRLAASYLGVVSGEGGPLDLPAVSALWNIVSVAYLAGGILLGIAFFRAAILARGAGILLAVGTASAALVPVLPHAVERYAAVPVGLALMWLGASLWSEQRAAVPTAGAERRSAPVGVAAAK